MKLLFDQNLSFRLAATVADIFPGSCHARDLGLATADDSIFWDYAKQHGFAIISKDGDFHQLSLVFGAPPKVVWLRVGNVSTAEIEALMRRHAATIHAFDGSDGALLVLDR